MKMNILIRKSAFGLLAVSLLFTLAFSFSQPAQAQSTLSQQTQIETLLALIAQLQAQLAAMQGGRSGQVDNKCIQLSRNLYLGMRDSDTAGEVSQLQRYLTDTGYYTYGEITGFYGPVTQRAVQKLQDARDIIETTGYGTVGNRTRTIVAETCSFATIDQTKVTSRSNSFELTGTADSDVEAVFVALISPHTSNISSSDNDDWGNLWRNGRYVAFTGDEVNRVRNGKWEVDFYGVPDGDYVAHVYESQTSEQKLLAKQPLSVSAEDVFDFDADDDEELLLGVKQSADSGGVKITLQDVFYTNGLSGSPRATFLVEPDGYNASIYSGGLNDYIPEGGGISDRSSKKGGIRIKIEKLSIPMNTATITIEPVSKG